MDAVLDFVQATARLFGARDSSDGGADAAPPGGAPFPNSGEGWLLQVPLRVYRDDEERYVGGLVLTQGNDNQFGDIWDARDIRILAHRFMEQSQHIDYMHTTKVVAVPVESFYFPTPRKRAGSRNTPSTGRPFPAVPGGWAAGSRTTTPGSR